jgi:glycosyltransferase involved in cell wall biosynthesis
MTRRSTDKIAVVIRAKNEAEWLGACLHAVTHQDWPNFEIAVVDNGSTDGTREIARDHGCKLVDYVEAPFNYSRALNFGIASVDAPYLAILSAHCVPVNEQWLARLAMNLRDESVVAVYGRQEPLPDSSATDKRDLWTTFGLDRKVQKQDYFFHNANSMIRRTAWESVPFNERIHGVEDRDWAKKVLRDGARIVYEPSASVFHHHGIHQDGNPERADRVVKIIELIQKDLT